MTLHLHLADLLPPIAEFLLRQSSGKDLVDLEREAIFQALLNSVRWTILRRARAQTEPISITTLETSDHFSNEWMSRAEIVARMEHTTGLGRPFAHIALFLIETRLDLGMSVAVESEVSIEGLGTVRPLTQIRSATDIQLFWRDIIGDFFTRGWESRGWESHGTFRSRQWSDYLERMASTLLYVEATRIPLPYRIELAENLAFSPGHSAAPSMEWPQRPETTFKWESVEPRPEGGRPTGA